jgi:hypothetical protein
VSGAPHVPSGLDVQREQESYARAELKKNIEDFLAQYEKLPKTFMGPFSMQAAEDADSFVFGAKSLVLAFQEYLDAVGSLLSTERTRMASMRVLHNAELESFRNADTLLPQDEAKTIVPPADDER